jgi:hypothetical protein
MTVTRVEGVKIERVADEILAVQDSTSSEAHALNQSAAAVFDLCDGQSSKAEMAAEIRRRTGLPEDEEIVDLALAELADAGLVDLNGSEPPAVARRPLIRRLALSSVAVMMLPVVETVLLPSGAMAADVCAPHFLQLPPTPTPTLK